MASKKDSENLSVKELEQLLFQKKRAQRHHRLQRLKQEGRVVVVPGLSPPETRSIGPAPVTALPKGKTPGRPRRLANKLLLLVEIGAVVGLIVLAVMAWNATRELNQEITQAQEIQNVSVASPLPTATTVIDVVILPSGHKPPVSGRPPEPGEAGDIPAHLLPIIEAYVPPPIPTPGPQQARRIQVPALAIDSPIVQGDDWDRLKKGVGQHLGSGLPGQDGNLVLSAHNDIYGEIFRHLDRLAPGDEIIISTDRQSYTYIVSELRIVEPTEVWVMSPTEHASATLISCYPYLINNRRIVVFADMALEGPLSGPSS
jgi:sortase A